MTAVVVAIDGPAGSGKSSVSKAAARQLGFEFLDTGAAYRALAWFGLERGIDLTDADAVLALLPEFSYQTIVDGSGMTVLVHGTDVSDAIREPRISAVVSESRASRRCGSRSTTSSAGSSGATHGDGIVVEGRDITTVVAPDADVRIKEWAAFAAHSHNGYLDTALGMGLPGLTLLIVVLVIAPLRNFQQADQGGNNGPLAMALLRIWLFGLYLSAMESFFLDRADPLWFTFLVAVFGLHFLARFRVRE